MIGDINQSIAAIASAPGVGLRGIVRCSGPGLLVQLDRCISSNEGPSLADRKRACVVPVSIVVDQPLGPVQADIFVWPTRNSYTRQPSAEIHCSASLPVLHEVLRCLERAGIRHAAPGEFTLRAFLAGRIDLTQAEAVLGVIDSRSDAEMQRALKQLAGGLSDPLESLRNRLLDLLAEIEAGLDFVEDDIEFVSRAEITDSLQAALDEIGKVVDQLRTRRTEQTALRVAICGRPNTGKSSLFNALAARAGIGAQAIVSSEAGTTRDYTSIRVESCGIEIELFDTAGIMPEPSNHSLIERYTSHVSDIDLRSGIMASAVQRDAHVVLFCIDASQEISKWERQQITESAGNPDFVVVKNKSDLPTSIASGNIRHSVETSSLTGDGLAELLSRIQALAERPADEASSDVVGTSDRCREGVERARDELEIALQYARSGQGDELIAGSLRMVLDELAIISGRVYTDDILDRVFSRFCIGK